MISYHVSKEDWRWLWNEGVALGLFRYGHVTGGSLEGLAGLAELGSIHIITTRPTSAVKDTLAWLNLMTDKIDLAGIHILSHHQPKSGVQPTPDVFIDDGMHNIQDIAENTDSWAIIYDQPWNQRPVENVNFPKVVRAYGWRHVVDIVAGIKEGSI